MTRSEAAIAYGKHHDRIEMLQERIAELEKEMEAEVNLKRIAKEALFPDSSTDAYVFIRTEHGHNIVVVAWAGTHKVKTIDDLRAEEQKEA